MRCGIVGAAKEEKREERKPEVLWLGETEDFDTVREVETAWAGLAVKEV